MKLNWAERWAVNNPARVWQQHLELRWMGKVASIPPGSRVLEVGCGRGAGVPLIQERFRPAAIHALDLDTAMVRRASRRLGSARNGTALWAADAVRLPFRSETFDAVFGFGVLHHVPAWQHAAAEIMRVLRPGGIYFLEELYPSLYQNALTRHVLLHPTKNRFYGPELVATLVKLGLVREAALEVPWVGLLAVFRRGPGPVPADGPPGVGG